MRIVAFYLPQYHRIKENDEWWGEGYTEWTNVRKGRKYFFWQKQPRIPLDDRYYDLDKQFNETMSWQISIAKKYGVYGFCFYHYWFEGGKKLLEKPVERFLMDNTLSMPFCLCWANESWTRTWNGSEKEIIMKQEYGDEQEWRKHFEYLMPFFKDERYIIIENKPVLLIYRPEIIPNLSDMLCCWNNMAIENGLHGLYIVAQGSVYSAQQSKEKLIDSYILYEPGYTHMSAAHPSVRTIEMIRKAPLLFGEIVFQAAKVRISRALGVQSFKCLSHIFDYDLFWKWIIKRRLPDSRCFLGAFVDWDNTARRKGKGARLFKGVTVEKFEHYFSSLVFKAKSESVHDIIFVNAWNEWGEGACLEPDEETGFGYLEAVRNAVLGVTE